MLAINDTGVYCVVVRFPTIVFMVTVTIQAWVRRVNAIGVFYPSTFKFAVLPDADRDAIRDVWFAHFGDHLELHHFVWDNVQYD